MESGLTLKQAMKKGKAKICTAEKCNQISRTLCEKCNLPACKFHMCARTKNKKKVKICDKCNYAEIKEQIDMENQKEKAVALEKLQNLNEKNTEAADDLKIDDKRIAELEEKIIILERGNEIRQELKLEDIKKEQFLKDQNVEMLSNLKAAIDNSTIIYRTENEKLVQVKSSVSNLQLDIGHYNRCIKELNESIKNNTAMLENGLSKDKLTEILCYKCLARSRGASVLKSVSVITSVPKQKPETCAKCCLY